VSKTGKEAIIGTLNKGDFWLRSEITRIEQQLAKLTDPLLEQRVEFSKLAEA
jgi:hypothetical protein